VNDRLDPRGVRFAAAVTTVVLAGVLLTGSGVLAALQALVFAVPVVAGMRWSPYGALYRALVAPRLGPPSEREDGAPVRFSQAVGLLFTVVAAVGYLSGAAALGIVATAFALVAAFLNAAFGFCLGCEMYGLLTRVRTAR
jgi:sterol desaturase/sphingolipid hydroxylase (fatty acid hydroxylase superfamily)